MTGRPLTIGLLWHSATSDNLGVGALTLAQIAILRSLATRLDCEVRFVILGWTDPRPAYVSGPDIARPQLRTRDLLSGGFIRAARGCDLVLDISAGDSFADIYGAKRFAKIIGGKLAVHLARRPLVVSPQTIGPFSRRWAQWAAFASLRRSEAVFARDALSMEALVEAGWTGPVTQVSDVALKLPHIPPAPRSSGPLRVGINVSGLLMNGGYTGANMFGLKADYGTAMRQVITQFQNMEDVEVHLVPHVITDTVPLECDWLASKALIEDLGPGIEVAPRFDSPIAAKSYIAGMDFFVGARMHACIAAFSTGVPVVPVAYSRKFEGLFGALGYTRTVDCRRLDTVAVVAEILAGFAARDSLKVEADEALAEGHRRLQVYEDVLEDILRQIV